MEGITKMDNVKILNLKKLSIKNGNAIYNKLIEGDYKAEIDLFTLRRDYKHCDVLFAGDNRNDSDLCISHFGYNFYTRPQRFIRGGLRYKTFSRALGALKRHLSSRFDTLTNTSNLRIYYNGTNIFNIEL